MEKFSVNEINRRFCVCDSKIDTAHEHTPQKKNEEKRK